MNGLKIVVPICKITRKLFQIDVYFYCMEIKYIGMLQSGTFKEDLILLIR